jgi:endonuclease/exonuclease/phosphatase family protein
MTPNQRPTLQSLFIVILTLWLWAPAAQSAPIALRIATFNIEDVRSADLDTPDNPRLKQIAAIIQRIRPNILLLSELAINQNPDQPSNADRFVEHYLAVPQGPDLKPIAFTTYTPPSNTGLPSGHDLDHSGTTISTPPAITKDQTDAGRAYGNDALGFGTFPGQYALAILVSPKLTIQTDQIRTFTNFLWKDLPGNNPPTNTDGSPWYDADTWNDFRLPSKAFADIPILLPNGSLLHALIAHPTPPAFDGPEGRNKHRNHDEIKLIRHYIDNDQALYDDQGRTGGLDPNSSFVIMGDLNADPSDGSSLNMVMMLQLLTSPKLADDAFPSSDIKVEGLDPTDTSHFKLRVDYLLPSADITITNSGIWRLANPKSKTDTDFPSDHFPVWIETIIP